MRLKTNLVISVFFIALLGFVYFYEIKGGEERRVEAERDRQLLDFSDHEVHRLTIDRGDTLLVLEHQDDVWLLTSPVDTDADVVAVERYLRTLREIAQTAPPQREHQRQRDSYPSISSPPARKWSHLPLPQRAASKRFHLQPSPAIL